MYDRAEINVKAGDGGNGVVSFRREKFVPFGGPDGGDGGDGGDVIIQVDAHMASLREYVHKRSYKAENGRHGSGKKMFGKRGEDLMLNVPVGTIVMAIDSEKGKQVLVDLSHPGMRLMVAKGGRGGMGNVHFASSTNQAPRIAQVGEKGEQKTLILELKILADVGIIGYPNAGKSTLLTAVSGARPKIADYPFTTLEATPGVVTSGEITFVMAEIPGIIEGAHLGKGLGHDFLRHVERTRMLLHLVDGGSADPAEDYAKVNAELALYDATLARKPQIVAINKIDIPEVRERIKKIREDFKAVGISPVFISAATGEGTMELMERAAEMAKPKTPEPGEDVGEPKKIFRPMPREGRPRIEKTGEIFNVVSPDLERIVAGSDLNNTEVVRQLLGLMSRHQVDRMLEKAGIKPGDSIRCGKLEWKW